MSSNPATEPTAAAGPATGAVDWAEAVRRSQQDFADIEARRDALVERESGGPAPLEHRPARGLAHVPTNRLVWSDIRVHLRPEVPVYDTDGVAWRCASVGQRLYRVDEGVRLRYWTPDVDSTVALDPPGLPEPPDGTRLEFVHETDLYAMRRDDHESRAAGWPAGAGGVTWVLYGRSAPLAWPVIWLIFGDSLRTATLLLPAGKAWL